MTDHHDDRGNVILIGDTILITAWGYGATLDMTGKTATVVGFTPTRIKVTGIYNGNHAADIDTMRGECVRVTVPVDGRHLITQDEAFAANAAKIDATR